MEKLIIDKLNEKIVLDELDGLFQNIKNDIKKILQENETLELTVQPKRLIGPRLLPEGIEVVIYAYGQVFCRITKEQDLE